MHSLLLQRPLHSQEQLVPPPPQPSAQPWHHPCLRGCRRYGKKLPARAFRKIPPISDNTCLCRCCEANQCLHHHKAFFPPPHCDDAFCTSSTNPIMLEILLVVARTPPQMFMGNISQIFNHSFNHSLSTVIFLYCILFMYLHLSEK